MRLIFYALMPIMLMGCMTPAIREAHRQAEELDYKHCEEYAVKKAGSMPQNSTDLEVDRWRTNRVLWFEKCMYDKSPQVVPFRR